MENEGSNHVIEVKDRARRQIMRDAWRLAKPYWISEEKWSAWGLLLAVVAFNLGNVYISVAINAWNNAFYNALQAFIPIGKWGTVHIPAYLVWTALFYGGVGTWLTVKIGRPLVPLNVARQRFEADFRFSLVRLRENAESVALSDTFSGR
jgi:ABC-type uncharacterized transport system fused permease/ATPase subunit